MDIYKIIQDVSNILGLSIKEPPVIYEDETTEYLHDSLQRSTKYKIIKENDKFIYLVHITDLNKYRCESMKISTIKNVYDIFVGFVSDSYYDSPIRFRNLKRQEETNDSFLLHYQKHPTYFYMGRYQKEASAEYVRVYVRRNTDECYNEYITE